MSEIQQLCDSKWITGQVRACDLHVIYIVQQNDSRLVWRRGYMCCLCGFVCVQILLEPRLQECQALVHLQRTLLGSAGRRGCHLFAATVQPAPGLSVAGRACEALEPALLHGSPCAVEPRGERQSLHQHGRHRRQTLWGRKVCDTSLQSLVQELGT